MVVKKSARARVYARQAFAVPWRDFNREWLGICTLPAWSPGVGLAWHHGVALMSTPRGDVVYEADNLLHLASPRRDRKRRDQAGTWGDQVLQGQHA